MTTLTGVERINYNNEIFELDGADVNEVLSLLDIDRENTSFTVENGTLYIMQQSGTKGLYSHTDDLSRFEDEEIEEVGLSAQLRQHLRASGSPVVKKIVYKMSDEGVLLPEIPGFKEDEVKMLLDSDFVYNETTTMDDLQEMKDFIKEQKVLKLAEILEIEEDKAKELFEFLKSL